VNAFIVVPAQVVCRIGNPTRRCAIVPRGAGRWQVRAPPVPCRNAGGIAPRTRVALASTCTSLLALALVLAERLPMTNNHALTQTVATGGALGVVAHWYGMSCPVAHSGKRSGIVAFGLLPRAIAGN
jgi:hypothetical protein